MAPITSFEAPVSLARRFPHITMKRYLTYLAILCIFYFLQWPSTEELMGRDRYTSRQEKVKINLSKLSSPTQLYVAFSVKRWDDGELADEGGGRFPPNLVTTVATNARTSKGIHRTIFCLLSNFAHQSFDVYVDHCTNRSSQRAGYMQYLRFVLHVCTLL